MPSFVEGTMEKPNKFQVVVSDIRTWIVFFFTIRLVGITNAPLEIGHSWRQALTNMMTRNMLDNGPDLLHPMIDMAGEKSGIIGSEFPFFNYLNYLMDLGLGFDHWHGRLLNLMVSSIGIYCFYRLICALFSKKIAFSSTILLLVSIWFGFSRKIMPDTFSVSLLLIALFFAHEFLVKGKKFQLLLFFLFTTLGILCKLPAIVLLSVFVVLPFLKEIKVSRKIAVYVSIALAGSISFWWYFIWVPALNAENGFPLFFPRGLFEGIQLALPLWQGFLEKFYFDAFFSFTAFAMTLIGIYWLIKRKNNLLLLALGTYALVFIFFAFKTGIVFPTHSYYIIPFVPVMALIAGFTFEKIPKKFYNLLLVAVTAESIANQQHDFFIKDSEKYKLTLEAELDAVGRRNDKIIINGNTSPQSIYFAHRKGWTFESEKLLQPGCIDSLQKLGAQVLIWDKNAAFHFTSDQSI